MSSGTTRRSPFSLFRNEEFAVLAAINFATGMSFATIIIALALYADLFEASGVEAGLFGTVYAIVRLVLVLPVGRYADVGDARRFLLVGMGLHVLVLGGFAFVQAVEHVIALRALQGIGAIVVYIAGTAVVGSICPNEERGLWIGTYQQVSAFASLSGDIAGGALLFLFGFEVTYAVLIVISILATLGVAVVLREGAVGGGSGTGSLDTFRSLLRRRAILALCSFRFAFSFGKMAVIIFLPIYARTEFGMSALLIGGILAGGKLTKSLTQGYVGTLADRVGGEQWFIVAGIVGYAIGTATSPFAPRAGGFLDPVVVSGLGREAVLPPAFFWLFGSYALLGIADSLRIPTSVALFVEEGEHFGAVGSSLSLRSVSWQVGAVVGPVSVGGMLDFVSFYAAFWLAAAFMIGAGVLFVGLYEAEPAPGTPVPADD